MSATQNVKDRYFDRELSWIDFNARVLSEAMNESSPLLERLKFIGIVSSNFDEFFMVRAASLHEYDPVTKEIYAKAFDLIHTQSRYFQETMLPELAKAGIARVLPQTLSERQHKYVQELFSKEILPLLTPVALRDDQPVSLLVGWSFYLIVRLRNPQKPAEGDRYAILEIPKNYPRMITLPSDSGHSFILLEDVIGMYAAELFKGYQIEEQGVFRITRAAELSLDEEDDEDFAKVMTEALRIRRKNYIVRMIASASDKIVKFLTAKLEIPEFKVCRVDGVLELKSIAQLAFQPMFEELKRPLWVPRAVPEFERPENLWTILKERDLVIHHPYESFDAFVKFLSLAAEDPDVLAIKQTLYRAGDASPVIDCLERAAERGKQVTVLVELKARFDEQRNIHWAERLVNAGATVLYGVAGLKTHAKACLVIRREIEGIKRYVHLGTGNYNHKTAAIYSDIGYFSSQEDLARDVSAFYNVITGYSQPVGFSKIEIAPFGLRRKLRRLILRESLRSKKESPGLIIAKMNSLVDHEIIEALYHASQAGVKIKLNVRGICCLKPGVPGMSENIEVTSIVDMFLEHSRIFYFLNGGDEEVYLSSADWMPRNLDRRLEILFPVEDAKNKKALIDLLKVYFKDNQNAWQLSSDGTYRKKEAGHDKKFRVQEFLCKKTEEDAALRKDLHLKELKPQKPKA